MKMTVQEYRDYRKQDFKARIFESEVMKGDANPVTGKPFVPVEGTVEQLAIPISDNVVIRWKDGDEEHYLKLLCLGLDDVVPELIPRHLSVDMKIDIRIETLGLYKRRPGFITETDVPENWIPNKPVKVMISPLLQKIAFLQNK